MIRTSFSRSKHPPRLISARTTRMTGSGFSLDGQIHRGYSTQLEWRPGERSGTFDAITNGHHPPHRVSLVWRFTIVFEVSIRALPEIKNLCFRIQRSSVRAKMDSGYESQSRFSDVQYRWNNRPLRKEPFLASRRRTPDDHKSCLERPPL